jgi:hypothetical protein
MLDINTPITKYNIKFVKICAVKKNPQFSLPYFYCSRTTTTSISCINVYSLSLQNIVHCNFLQIIIPHIFIVLGTTIPQNTA